MCVSLSFKTQKIASALLNILNPKEAGGAKWPTANLNDHFSATECPIDLKTSCIFKFVQCLKVYKTKLINLDLGGTLEGL